MSKKVPTMRELLSEMDPEMVKFLYGEGGLLDDTPPVLPMLKKWTGSPKFHLNNEPVERLKRKPGGSETP